jgi:hypothetical protein
MKDTIRSEAYIEKKVVYQDDQRTKVVNGTISFEFGFLKVTNKLGQSILINKKYVISIKDVEW